MPTVILYKVGTNMEIVGNVKNGCEISYDFLIVRPLRIRKHHIHLPYFTFE